MYALMSWIETIAITAAVVALAFSGVVTVALILHYRDHA